jgi:release factor glutamine methyltransferase
VTSLPALPDLAAVAARLRAAGCVYAEEEAALLLDAAESASSPATELQRLLVRREAGEPLEQLLGWADFDGLRLHLEPGAFVPRARTLLVAREAVRLAHRAAVPATALDLCCGVGAIGALLQRELPAAVLVAVDVDGAAVAAARRNLEAGGGIVRQGDLFGAVPTEFLGGFDVIAVNAPYVPSDEIAHMPPEAREHEHRVALDGGTDGLALHRRIAAEAGRWLRPAGALVIECAERQAEASAALFARAGFSSEILSDEALDATAVRVRPS